MEPGSSRFDLIEVGREPLILARGHAVLLHVAIRVVRDLKLQVVHALLEIVYFLNLFFHLRHLMHHRPILAVKLVNFDVLLLDVLFDLGQLVVYKLCGLEDHLLDLGD